MIKNIASVLFLLLLSTGCFSIKSGIIYESDSLQIKKLTKNTFVHITFLETTSFGVVACNGLIVFDEKEAIVYDTPVDSLVSVELINWIVGKRKSKINAVVVTHFHIDCLGGLSAFHEKGIPSYSSNLTIELAKVDNVDYPQNGFEGLLQLPVGNEEVLCAYLGEGHTRDNIVGYFESEEVLFGGCLVKSIRAGKGNLNDANVSEWPKTVRLVKSKFDKAETVVPGHGKPGGPELLDYTIELFEKD